MSDGRGVEPWERLATETSRAYAAFREYRDLGATRSLRQVTGPPRTIAGWSLRHRWGDRVRAWDAECYRLDDARRLDAIRAMDELHEQVARSMIAAGLNALRDAKELTPHQAARLLDVGTRLQRAALLGEHLPGPVAVLDVEELSPLERVARELAGTA